MKTRILVIICLFAAFGAMQAQQIKTPKELLAAPEQIKPLDIAVPEEPQTGTKIFTTEMMMQLKRISEITVSPDGKWIIYKLGTPSVEDNKVYNDLYAISIDGTQTKQLTKDPASEYGAVWSPDSKKIAYLSAKDGSPQIYVMDFPNGKPQKVSNVAEGVGNLLWSPDGKNFAFTSEVKLDQNVVDKYPKYPKATARIYEKLPVRHWDEWTDDKYSHLFIMPVTGGAPKDITPGEKYDTPLKPFGGAEEICWSPDGTEIAYTSKKVDDYVHSTDSDIYLYNLKNGTTQNITKGMVGYDKVPMYSPDGKWIAFHSMERAGFESDRVRLMLYDRKTGKIDELSKKLDQWVGNTVWSPKSDYLYFSAENGPLVHIYQMSVATGEWKILTSGRMNYDGGLGITKDGKMLVAGRRTMHRPTDIFTVKLDNGEVNQLTDVNSELYKDLILCKIEEITITSSDNKPVHCWLLFPPNFDPTKKYPMITYCQGGPQSTISQYFSFRWNFFLMASKGYVVLAPNRRGVPGFGQAWNDAISKDWGGMPMQDLLSATDQMSSKPYIDKHGLCAVGASAGGYAAFWLAGNHQKRFSAFVSHCGVFNLESKYGSTEELFFPDWEFGGPYWEKKHRRMYDQNSPHKFADNWDTPIMISTGEKDFRVPFTQSLEAFTVAQAKGIPSKLVIYPDENHWILKPQNSLVWHNEFFEFLDKYCKK